MVFLVSGVPLIAGAYTRPKHRYNPYSVPSDPVFQFEGNERAEENDQR